MSYRQAAGSDPRSGGIRTLLVRSFERVFRMMRHAFTLVGAVFRHESVATSDFSHSSDCSVSPGGWSGSARVVQNSPHVGPSNRVTVPRNHVAGRHACLSPGHKRPAALMAPPSEASNRRAYGPPIMRHALTAIESAILLRGPSLMLHPGLEIRLGLL